MIVVDIALGALAVTFVMGIVRAILGPSLADRAIAADLCLYAVVAVLALLAVRFHEVLLDLVLVVTLLAFIGTLSLARLIGTRRR